MGLKFYRSLDKDDEGKYVYEVDKANPIEATQSSDGLTPAIFTMYLLNDGRRYNASVDPSEGTYMPGQLWYKDVIISSVGATALLQAPIDQYDTDTTVLFSIRESGLFFTEGTVVKLTHDSTPEFEYVYVREVVSDTAMVVERGYKGTKLRKWPINAVAIAMNDHIVFGLPNEEEQLNRDKVSWLTPGAPLIVGDIVEDDKPFMFWVRVALSQKLPVQTKQDVYFSITGIECPV